MRIELPPISRGPDSQAHPYPIQLALATQEYLQSVIFLYAVSDAAAGAHVQDADALDALRHLFEQLQPGVWDDGWALLEKYGDVLEKLVSQNSLIAMVSQWDWYVRRLGAFVAFAQVHVGDSTATSDHLRQLRRLDRLPIGEQIELLQLGSGVPFGIAAQDLLELREMALVRNLGMHNRWEVDQKYMESSKRTGWQVGELRLFDDCELQNWHVLLVEAVNHTSTTLACRFDAAPDYSAEQADR